MQSSECDRRTLLAHVARGLFAAACLPGAAWVEAVTPSRPSVLPTGFRGLDELLGGGFRPGELVLLSARHELDLESLGFNLLKNVTLDQGRAALLFYVARPRCYLDSRLAELTARTVLPAFREGPLTVAEVERLARARERLLRAPLVVDDTPYVSSQSLGERARRCAAGLELIVFDDFRFFDELIGEGTDAATRYAARACRMREVARELRVPLVCLVLDRRHEIGGGGPGPSGELRKVGPIADTVLRLRRGEEPETRRLALLKSPAGRTGEVAMTIDPRGGVLREASIGPSLPGREPRRMSGER